jgi:hypothetical protein
MYPALEIHLHLNGIWAAQRRSPAAFEAAFRPSTYGTNLLPFRRILGEVAGCEASELGGRVVRQRSASTAAILDNLEFSAGRA